MDRRIHFSWSKYLQKGKPQLPFDVPDSNSIADVGIGRGVSRRSRHYPQKVGLLEALILIFFS